MGTLAVLSIANWIILLLLLVTTVGLLLHQDWRWGVGFLAVQYIGVFWLVQTHWPVSMAAVKLVTGWVVCVILGMGTLRARLTSELEPSRPQGRLFRIFTAGIIIAATFAISLRASAWLGLSLELSWGSLLLMGMGLLQLGISARPFRVILGLVTVLGGFEIIYAAVESSVLVAALLSVVNLGLALSGGYFMSMSEDENL
jgi:hypothetical protein